MFGESNVSYKKGESSQFPITIDFSSKSHTLAMRGEPVVTEIKLNDVTICSGSGSGNNENVNVGQREEETKKNDKCVKFEMGEPNDGRWNGTFTLYSKPSNKNMVMDLIFNNPIKEYQVINY